MKVSPECQLCCANIQPLALLWLYQLAVSSATDSKILVLLSAVKSCGDEARREGPEMEKPMEGPSAWLAICNLQCFFTQVYAKVPKICRIQICHETHDLYNIRSIIPLCRVC